MMALYIAPNLYIQRDSGIIGDFYEDIAVTLSRLYRLFTVSFYVSVRLAFS